MTLHCEAGHADGCSEYCVEDHHEQGRIKCSPNKVEDKETPTSHVRFILWLAVNSLQCQACAHKICPAAFIWHSHCYCILNPLQSF